jgi:hypothetical protein
LETGACCASAGAAAGCSAGAAASATAGPVEAGLICATHTSAAATRTNNKATIEAIYKLPLPFCVLLFVSIQIISSESNVYSLTVSTAFTSLNF